MQTTNADNNGEDEDVRIRMGMEMPGADEGGADEGEEDDDGDNDEGDDEGECDNLKLSLKLSLSRSL
jgi:hypothetical protein